MELDLITVNEIWKCISKLLKMKMKIKLNQTTENNEIIN